MDVFGTVTNAIALTQMVVAYIRDVKGAKQDRLQLHSEAAALGVLLEILRRRLDNTDPDYKDDGILRLLKAGIKGPLHECYEDLRSIAGKLEGITHTNTTSGTSFSFRETMKVATWPFRQEETRAMLGRMERLKSLILLALQTSVVEFVEKARDELKNLGLNVGEIEGVVLTLEEGQREHMKATQSLRVSLSNLLAKFHDSADSIIKTGNEITTISRNQREMQVDLKMIGESVYNQEHQDLVKWLSPLDFSEKHNMTFEKHAHDTGEWFLKHEKFLAWRRGDPGYKTLWCPGHAGVGKSVMTSLVINELRKAIPENAALVFIYLEYKTEYTTSQLTEAILKQLLQRRMTQSGLESLRKYKAGNRPTSEELFDMLKVEVECYSRVLVVIDALDEIDTAVGDPLLERLQGLRKVSLFATSRDTGEVDLQPCQRLEITADRGDVGKYIKGRLESSAKFKELLLGSTINDQERIVTGIMKKADGMFLLARLHTNFLETKLRFVDLLRALEQLPDNLYATYDEAMSRIGLRDSDRMALAYRVISWLIHAARPMTIHDLQYALLVEDGATALDIRDLYRETDLTSVCVGLVVLQENAASSQVTNPRASSSKVIGFVHSTAQQYFRDSAKQQYFRKNPNVSAQIADSASFAITCLRHLTSDIFENDVLPGKDSTQKRLTENPFTEYAIFSWGVHAREHWNNEIVRNLTMELLHDNERLAIVGPPLRGARNLSAIHICVHFRLNDCLKSLLDNGHDVNSRDSEGNTVVSYAALGGQVEVMQLLLARGGVDVNPKGWNGTTPLAQAVIGGHKGIVQLLLKRDDLDVNQRDDFENTPIFHAVWNGRADIVKLLLAWDGIDINLGGWDGRTPLSVAAHRGYEEIAQLLLRGSELHVNRHDNFGNTPIIHSVRNGHTSIVKLLLSQGGIDINSQGQGGYTPLSVAAHYGHEAIVQLLLARNELDINQRDNIGNTSIIHAVRNGHTGIVKLLLARDGVDVNSQGWDGRTPLLVAARLGYGDIMQLLLARKDLNINRRDNFGNAPIIHAVQKGHTGIVELLLAQDGVEINLQGHHGCTPLSVAIMQGHEAIIQLLLARADLDTSWKNEDGHTYLAVAAFRNNEMVARWLLAKGGVDINSKGSNGQGPLTLAARQGSDAVVKLLLDQHGIDVDIVDSRSCTPLDHANRQHREGVIKLLQAAGGRTARELGAESGGRESGRG